MPSTILSNSDAQRQVMLMVNRRRARAGDGGRADRGDRDRGRASRHDSRPQCRATLDSDLLVPFCEALLECCALQLASGSWRSVFGRFEVIDPALLAPAKLRRAQLAEDDQAIEDCSFQFAPQFPTRLVGELHVGF